MQIKDEFIFIDEDLKSKEDIFSFLENVLIKGEIGNKDFIDSMKQRDKTASVAIGNYLAIPHCDYSFSSNIKKQELVFIKLKNKVMWDENEVLFVIALILKNEGQLEILANIGITFSDEDLVLEFHKNLTKKEQVNKFIEENS
ncbi:PTS system, mannitol-specific IIA component [Spiroplasma helicoides]|uniref:PTS system, mannitol-specific IIA component n=1 Tax=Spiroplasma helicoides TaxID=216938 RepID=A0A1B3SL67_9MOLU|nr:PTS sugar transporter subunit IIA [Spiroplasma helicoides]AOG60678.1 PTS system, mannitol-specific IIA component [Spiroplasma helicoides]